MKIFTTGKQMVIAVFRKKSNEDISRFRLLKQLSEQFKNFHFDPQGFLPLAISQAKPRKSSCMTARGIPPAEYQVLWVEDTPVLSWLRGSPILAGGGVSQSSPGRGYPILSWQGLGYPHRLGLGYPQGTNLGPETWEWTWDLGTVSWTDTHLWKNNLKSYYVRGW